MEIMMDLKELLASIGQIPVVRVVGYTAILSYFLWVFFIKDIVVSFVELYHESKKEKRSIS